MARRNDRMETIVSLAKRRGFVFPSSDIYGGLRASWDYGPLGVEMKNNIKRQWWKTMIQERDDIVGLDSSVILAREVWEASGHITEFVDPLTECQSCHRRFRADHLLEAYEDKHGHPPENGLADIACPHCGTRGAFTEPRMFNGLLRTYLGATEDESGLAYLRPETAQGIFINFRNVLQTSRKKVPFGIGQIGKSFRNEITPGNFIFRTREFEQMEMEFFVKPGHRRGMARVLDRDPAGLVHRSRACAGRTCACTTTRRRSGRTTPSGPWTSSTATSSPAGSGASSRASPTGPTSTSPSHAKHSGQDLSYLDQDSGERFVPYVIEPAAGVDRSMLMFLLDAYGEDEAPDAKGKLEKRTVLRLDPRLAPVKAAVLPLSRNADLSPKARDLAARLRKRWNTDFDDASAIGRRYRRQDEIGTPFCVTVDFDTLTDDAVTVRERDSMKQERVAHRRASRPTWPSAWTAADPPSRPGPAYQASATAGGTVWTVPRGPGRISPVSTLITGRQRAASPPPETADVIQAGLVGPPRSACCLTHSSTARPGYRPGHRPCSVQAPSCRTTRPVRAEYSVNDRTDGQRVPRHRGGRADDPGSGRGEQRVEADQVVAAVPQVSGVAGPVQHQPAVGLEAAARAVGVQQPDLRAVPGPLLERERPVGGPGQRLPNAAAAPLVTGQPPGHVHVLTAPVARLKTWISGRCGCGDSAGRRRAVCRPGQRHAAQDGRRKLPREGSAVSRGRAVAGSNRSRKNSLRRVEPVPHARPGRLLGHRLAGEDERAVVGRRRSRKLNVV